MVFGGLAKKVLIIVPLSKCPQQRNQVNKKALQSGRYPITRRLFVIVKQNGQIDESSGNAYANFMLSDQGQDSIDKAGFIRIRWYRCGEVICSE